MSSESRKQFGEVVFATGPVSTSHLPLFNLGFESRKSKPRPAAGRCVFATPQWKSEMGELGLVARLRKRLTLGRKVKAESSKSNGITTKTLPRRPEGNSRTDMK